MFSGTTATPSQIDGHALVQLLLSEMLLVGAETAWMGLWLAVKAGSVQHASRDFAANDVRFDEQVTSE